MKSDENIKTEETSNEKPFECTTCGKRYHHLSSLWLHEKNHNGLKPFECTNCGKRFLTQNMLKRHEDIHLTEVVTLSVAERSVHLG